MEYKVATVPPIVLSDIFARSSNSANGFLNGKLSVLSLCKISFPALAILVPIVPSTKNFQHIHLNYEKSYNLLICVSIMFICSSQEISASQAKDMHIFTREICLSVKFGPKKTFSILGFFFS